MNAKNVPLWILSAVCLAACMSAGSSDRSQSICDLDISGLRSGAHVRFVAVYAPSSMHGDMLYSPRCKNNRLLTYGYDLARGVASREFHDEVSGEALNVSTIEYLIDVAGVIERDEDGEWLRAETVYSYEKVK